MTHLYYALFSRAGRVVTYIPANTGLTLHPINPRIQQIKIQAIAGFSRFAT